MTTDEWVRKLNKLGAEMDEIAVSIHPSAWQEQLAELNERYRKLAATKTTDSVRTEQGK